MWDRWYLEPFRKDFLNQVANNLSAQEPDLNTIHTINEQTYSGVELLIKISGETLIYKVQVVDRWGWVECTTLDSSRVELLALSNEQLITLLHHREVTLPSKHSQKIEQFWRLIYLATMYDVCENFNMSYLQSGWRGPIPHMQDINDFMRIFKLLDALMQDREWVNSVKTTTRR